MRHIKFTYRGKKFHVILKECPVTASNEILEKVAVQCYRHIAKQEQSDNEAAFVKTLLDSDSRRPHKEKKSYTIYIKRLWIPDKGNPLFQFIYKNEDNTNSNAFISSASLDSTVSDEFKFHHDLAELPSDPEPPAFRANADDTNEWVLYPSVLNRLFTLKSKLYIKLEPVPFVDEMLAHATQYNKVIDDLCHKLLLPAKDRQCAQHLLTRTLWDEFGTLAQKTCFLTLYKSWVDDGLNKHESIRHLPAHDTLQSYIEKQTAAAIERITAAKTLAVENYTHGKEHDDKFQLKIAGMQQHEYAAKLNKFHYLRMNIMIALYNAARLAYNAIIQKYDDTNDKSPEKLKADIEHFNAVFKHIAKINPDTLRLTQLQKLLQRLPALPALSKHRGAQSLENFVDLVLETVAEDNAAFTLVKQQLEYFQAQLPTNTDAKQPSLFNAIRNPVSSSFVPKAVLDRLAKDKKKECIFEFTSTICVLEPELDHLEQQFTIHLDVIKSMLEGFEIELSQMLKTKDQAFDEYLATQRANILALHRTLEKAASIDARINTLFEDLYTHQLTLNKINRKFGQLNAIAVKYGIPLREFASFKTAFFGEDVWDEPDALLDSISTIRDQADTVRSEVARVKELAGQCEPLDKAGINRDLCTLTSIEINKLNQCIADTGVIATKVNERKQDVAELKNWAYAFKEIDNYLSLIAKCESATEDLIKYTAVINGLTSFSHIKKEGLDFTASLADVAFVKKQLQDYNDAITKQINEFARVTSEDNCLVTALKNRQAQANQNADAALQKHNRDIYDLARCKLAMNNIFDFDYWQRVASFWEHKVKVRGQRDDIDKAGNYEIPVVIFNLVCLSNRPNCKLWRENPEHARQLMTVLRNELTREKVGENIAAFKEIICGQVINEINDVAPELAALTQPRDELANLMQRQMVEPVNRQPMFQKLTYIPYIFEKHPNAYHALVGAIVGVVIVSAVTLLCLGLIYGGAAPILALAAGSVMSVGGSGLMTGLVVATAAVTAATCAVIGYFLNYDKNCKKRATEKTIFGGGDVYIPFSHPNAANRVSARPPQGQTLGFGPAARLHANGRQSIQLAKPERRSHEL